MKVDLHIIPTPGFEANYELMCQTVDCYAQTQPINRIEGVYVEGNMLEARWQSYSLGTSKYVTFADGDDFIIDLDWVQDAVDMLEEDPTISAVYPRWFTSKNGRLYKPASEAGEWTPQLHRSFAYQPLAHHLTIMRRQNVIELLREARKNCPCIMKSQDRYLLSAQVRYGRLVAFSNIAYDWRLRDGTARSSIDPPEVVKWIEEQARIDRITLSTCLSPQSTQTI